MSTLSSLSETLATRGSAEPRSAGRRVPVTARTAHDPILKIPLPCHTAIQLRNRFDAYLRQREIKMRLSLPESARFCYLQVRTGRDAIRNSPQHIMYCAVYWHIVNLSAQRKAIFALYTHGIQQEAARQHIPDRAEENLTAAYCSDWSWPSIAYLPTRPSRHPAHTAATATRQLIRRPARSHGGAEPRGRVHVQHDAAERYLPLAACAGEEEDAGRASAHAGTSSALPAAEVQAQPRTWGSNFVAVPEGWF
ncbi:hypothetical protein ON010_g14452 [Phytophthora cinnamomi]|nr:hypothetical protein ON010_g14452 [Phytophthora cinnamomi]